MYRVFFVYKKACILYTRGAVVNYERAILMKKNYKMKMPQIAQTIIWGDLGHL